MVVLVVVVQMTEQLLELEQLARGLLVELEIAGQLEAVAVAVLVRQDRPRLVLELETAEMELQLTQPGELLQPLGKTFQAHAGTPAAALVIRVV
jgi:hypothetical protein